MTRPLRTGRRVGMVMSLLLALMCAMAPAAWSAATATKDHAPQDLSAVIADHAKRGTASACYGSVVITSRANGRLVSAELGYGGDTYGMLRARATAVGPWELFTAPF